MYLTVSIFDSNMVLNPVHDRDMVSKYYQAMIPELMRFPYFFLKKIGLKNFTFANNAKIKSGANQSVLNKRLYQGAIPL